MRELAPGGWFNSVTPAEHHQLYMAQLAQLDARAVVEKIAKFGAGRDVALLCFEKPGELGGVVSSRSAERPSPRRAGDRGLRVRHGRPGLRLGEA